MLCFTWYLFVAIIFICFHLWIINLCCLWPPFTLLNWMKFVLIRLWFILPLIQGAKIERTKIKVDSSKSTLHDQSRLFLIDLTMKLLQLESARSKHNRRLTNLTIFNQSIPLSIDLTLFFLFWGVSPLYPSINISRSIEWCDLIDLSDPECSNLPIFSI